MCTVSCCGNKLKTVVFLTNIKGNFFSAWFLLKREIILKNCIFFSIILFYFLSPTFPRIFCVAKSSKIMAAAKLRVRPGIGSKCIFTAALLKASCFLQHWVCSPWIRPFGDRGISLRFLDLTRFLCLWGWIHVYTTGHERSHFCDSYYFFVFPDYFVLLLSSDFFLKSFCCEPLMSMGSATAIVWCRGVGRGYDFAET